MTCFIINPAAGSGRAKAARPIIERIMRENGLAHEFIYTDGPGDFARVSGLIDFGAAKTIACVGGDGTVQEYAGLAVRRDVSFAVIPAGSGNDGILSLPGGAGKLRSFEEKTAHYTEKIVRGKTASLDIIAVNGGYCFNIGGTGIDIQVLRDALPLKRFFGGAAYFLSLIKNAATYKAGEITLTVDGNTVTDRFLLLAVCNGAYYGGGLHIAPAAAMDDGLITLCAVRRMPRLKLMALFPAVKPGKHTGFKEVSFVNCSRVSLEFEGKKTVNLDGNLFEMESPLDFEILRGGIRVVV